MCFVHAIKVVHWFITTVVIISTQCLLFVLDSQHAPPTDQPSLDRQPLSYSTMFWIVVSSLGLWIPIWKYHLAQYKVMLRGPWDIPTKDVMKLDYKL